MRPAPTTLAIIAAFATGAAAQVCNYEPCVPVSQSYVSSSSSSSRARVGDGSHCCCLANAFVSCTQRDAADGGVVVDFGTTSGVAFRSRHGAAADAPSAVGASQSFVFSLDNPTAHITGSGFAGVLQYTQLRTMRNKVHHTVFSRVRKTYGAAAAAAGSIAGNATVGGNVPCEINSLSTSIGVNAPTFPPESCWQVCAADQRNGCSRFSICFQVPDSGLPEVWVAIKYRDSVYDFTLLSAFLRDPSLSVEFENCDGEGASAYTSGFSLFVDPETDMYKANVVKGFFSENGGPTVATIGGPVYQWPKDGSSPGKVIGPRDV